ncbi:MAG: energy transducer TonB [Fimbriimonadaceae bacterium]|nr:energy transducer TonB [Chitinophagales bacterium]
MQVSNKHIRKLFSRETIVAYLQNKLSGDEKVLFEKHLQEDEFLKDAIEGYRMMPATDVNHFVDKIVKDIDIIVGNRKIKQRFISSQTRPLAVAALMLVFIGIAWFAVWFTNNSAKNQEIAKADEMYDAGETRENNSSIQLFDTTAQNETTITQLETTSAGKNISMADSSSATSYISSGNTSNEKAIGYDDFKNNNQENDLDGAVEGEQESVLVYKDDAIITEENIKYNEIPASTQTNAGVTENELSEVIVTEKTTKREKKLKKEDANNDDRDDIYADRSVDLFSYNSYDTAYSNVDQVPQFTGGQIALDKFIHDRIVIPRGSEDFEGTIYVKIIIDENGKVTYPEIVKGADDALNKEVLRVISIMPNWIPGKLNDVNVKVTYTLPIEMKQE